MVAQFGPLPRTLVQRVSVGVSQLELDMINGGALNQQARFRVLGLRSAGDRRGLRLFRKLFPGHGFYLDY